VPTHGDERGQPTESEAEVHPADPESVDGGMGGGPTQMQGPAPTTQPPGPSWAICFAVIAVGAVLLIWISTEAVGPLGVVHSAVVGGLIAIGAVAGSCWLWLKREREYLSSLWDDVYFRLRERCQLVRELNVHLRRLLRTNPKLVDDIQFLLQSMEETNDPRTHAAVQNSLVLTVQTAVEQFHRSIEFQSDRDLRRIMRGVEAVDDRLAPLRDRYNDRVQLYNRSINTPPLSFLSRLTHSSERALFPMLIPWWSTEASAYGHVTASDIRHQLETWKAPLIILPSQQQSRSGGGSRVAHVPKSDGAAQQAGRETGPDAPRGTKPSS